MISSAVIHVWAVMGPIVDVSGQVEVIKCTERLRGAVQTAGELWTPRSDQVQLLTNVTLVTGMRHVRSASCAYIKSRLFRSSQ